MAGRHDFGTTGLWTRINALGSPFALNDVVEIVGAIGHKLGRDHAAERSRVRGIFIISISYWHSWKPVIALAGRSSSTPSWKTPEGVNNVQSIASASPRMHGISLGPADLAAARAMKTTRVGGGHPGYKVLGDVSTDGHRSASQQDLWHYTLAKMVDACAATGIKPFLRTVRRFLRSGGLRSTIP